MTDHHTPNRIFKISELTRLIASQLVLISQQSAVNLACACRCLEEPALSTLWETQGSLWILLEVLPGETWDCQYLGLNIRAFRIVGDPSPEAWNRVQRYASWMHQVRSETWRVLGEDTFRQLRLNSPPDGWFPALQDLSWWITTSNLPYTDLLFSPYLKRVSIFVQFPWNVFTVPSDVQSAITSTISALPTSTLQLLRLYISHRMTPWEHFKNSLSSIVLRCGPSFTEYDSPVPLSDAAVNHLIRLPRLRAWRIYNPPPEYSTSSLPLVFPPLEQLTLEERAVNGWLSLFKRLEDGVFTAQGTTPLSGVKESLNSLHIWGLPDQIIDASFTSPIQRFQNLVKLKVKVSCYGEVGVGQCTFKLNDDHVAELATALPQLGSLLLGYVCPKNTCATTVACLLHISAHCVKLHRLVIHFNTTNIVDDFKKISEDPRFQELRSRSKCTLTFLGADQIPLILDEPGFETVAKGMIDIFPSLRRCDGDGRGWDELSMRILKFQEE